MKDNVVLRKIELSDTDNIVKWRNAKFVKENLFSQIELTAEQHIWWYNNKVLTGECDQYIISIYNDDFSLKDIGTVFIKSIDRNNKKGEFGIQIGEDSSRGKGYGFEATKQIIDIAFEKLGLNRIYLFVLSNNIAAIKTYKKAGFIQEGILRQDYYRDGVYYDVICMSIIKSDIRS